MPLSNSTGMYRKIITEQEEKVNSYSFLLLNGSSKAQQEYWQFKHCIRFPK